MKIVIAAASGNVGHRAAECVLRAGLKPVLLARNRDKIAPLLEQGALWNNASSDDAVAVLASCQSADALFWLTPPALREPSLQGWYQRTAQIAAQAITRHGIPRVVHISSIGAGAAANLGTVSHVGDVEAILERTGASIVNLRPGYFMQNILGQASHIRQRNEVRMSFAADMRIPWISADDIGDVAARYLLDPTWRGQWCRNLMGPESLNLNDVTALLSNALGRKIVYRRLPLSQLPAMFAGFGANPVVQAELTELMRALSDPDGIYATARTPDAMTPTTMADFIREQLPLLR